MEKQLTGYPSIDKPWLKYFTEDDLNFNAPLCSVYKNIYDNNKDYLQDTALIFFGHKISFGRMFQEVERSARALKSVGIKKGDFVTLCSAAVPEAVYLILACSRIGAIANFINPMFTPEQMADRINETESKWIFVLDAMNKYIEAALPNTCIEHVVIVPVTNSLQLIISKVLYMKSEARKILDSAANKKQHYYSWKHFSERSKEYSGSIDEPYEKDRPAVMVYSSGSTGASKGILLTNDGMNATIANYQISSFTHKRTDTLLQMIPIWFSTGIVFSLLMPLVNGIAVITEPQFSKEAFAKDLLKYKPSICLTATSLWLYVIDAEEMKNADLSNFTYPSAGGEKFLGKDELRLNAFFKEHGSNRIIYKGYGMCELGCTVAAYGDSKLYKPKLGGTGYPILHAVVSAFDIETDEELKYGQHGELRVNSPARMKEYYKNPEATAKFFKKDKNGVVWGCTGDIGYIDEDGEIFVLGRATDSCRTNDGKTIYFFDIEDEILKEDTITQCKVIDTTIEEKQELIAHVAFKNDVHNQKERLESISRELHRTLPAHMIPKYFKVWTSLPVHSNGKRDVETLKKDIGSLIEL